MTTFAPIHLFGARTWGFATGGWYRTSSDPAELRELVQAPFLISSKPHAIEATAQTPDELAAWAQYLEGMERRDLGPYVWSVHAPSKGTADHPAPFADLLRIPEFITSIVVHPDVINLGRDGEVLDQLGSRLVIENMDARKGDGRDGEQLARWFTRFPEAGLCLDLAHASTLDATGALALAIYGEHGHRLRQIHVSQVEPDGHHLEVSSRACLMGFAALIEEIDPAGHVPVIVESQLGEV